jgi:hypothetical protein
MSPPSVVYFTTRVTATFAATNSNLIRKSDLRLIQPCITPTCLVCVDMANHQNQALLTSGSYVWLHSSIADNRAILHPVT